jgi:hypothetical protein
MNFERHHIDPFRTLNVGRRAIKKQKMQDLLYKERFGSMEEMWMGMGLIIDLIKETKDVEYLEIFKEDFLAYFAIPVRRGEKWRWEELYQIIPQFPNKGVFRAHELIMEIVSTFAKLP